MRGLFVALVVSIFSVAALSAPVQAAGNPRYAALVMDADTGQIVFEEHAREKRYPASLTKMMTLYMTFEALEKGTLRLDSKLDVSKKAAAQPQTNISLRVGEKLTVEQCIKALVTRSANDAAVVLAEGLGKTVWNFGVMMTNKSASLGMKNTVFRNPNGLPDSRQYTTAYDMALLGIALRRDYPQYYHYFKTRSFSYKGRTYGNHNRVLDRLPGVDGIKTGYINASGFNLVSSLKRDNVNMVAVVMGGNTGASRDNLMVKLLGKHFTQIAQMKKNPNYAVAQANLPTPQLKPQRDVQLASAAPLQAAPVQAAPLQAAPVQLAAKPEASAEKPKIADAVFNVKFLPQDKPVAANAVSFQPLSDAARSRVREQQDVTETAKVATPATPVAPVASPVTLAAAKPAAQGAMFDVSFISSAQASPKPNTLDYQYAMLNTPSAGGKVATPAVAQGKDWGIQVGAFRSEQQAREAISKAMRMVKQELGNAYMNIASEGQQEASIHRARLGNLSRDQAELACRKLNSMNSACFPLRIN